MYLWQQRCSRSIVLLGLERRKLGCTQDRMGSCRQLYCRGVFSLPDLFGTFLIMTRADSHYLHHLCRTTLQVWVLITVMLILLNWPVEVIQTQESSGRCWSLIRTPSFDEYLFGPNTPVSASCTCLQSMLSFRFSPTASFEIIPTIHSFKSVSRSYTHSQGGIN